MADRGSRSPADASRDSRSSIDSRSPTSNNAPFRLGTMPPLQPRHSFSDSLRAAPSSPRARRQPSLPQSAVQSLIDNPPSGNAADPAFAGRDWTQISIGELVTPSDLRFVEMDTGIEEATKVLIDSGIPVIMIREKPEDKAAIGTFDYADLNAYLLLVVGLVQPSEEHVGAMRELAKKARDGKEIPLRDVKKLGLNVPITNLPPSASLMRAVEIFGGGIHRIIVTREGTNEVVGIFSQWRLVKFLWENGQSFPVIDQLYPRSLAELKIGSQQVISINGDRPLSEALELMNSEGISSIAVVDNQLNVVGNISVVDVKLLTKSSSLPLLNDTCIHFISVILSTRGLHEGKDSFPVFHVHPQSTLAHTVAKIVATRSHRMWVTDPQSPASSGPSTPSHSTVHIPLNSPPTVPAQPRSPSPPPSTPLPSLGPTPNNNWNLPPPTATPHLGQPHNPAPQPPAGPPQLPYPPSISTSIPAASLPSARLSGHLVGLVSLTDILNLYARASGLSPADPSIYRSQRRRSSSSSLGIRKSGDVGRDIGRDVWNRGGT
ncbi:CBS domain-containing protein [Blastomyces gilchristii SLH14081]|uniref:Protein SDS23 n=2 Tax=Blastomyces TaxID=229219 RepID=A0A179UGE4_BLAGS|nr:CBS domain-containing protein [Blastomyces gilchristii SLH14081]EGE86458.1 CBS domain-containing protein [Blastomyces dermatitidis ATCC 18188]OAT06299.1 CBS domain-containing protein [Blastomyces gilchristii SLH14081]